MNCLNVKELSCRFKDKEYTLKNYTDSFNEGFVYWIKGDNGTGKTTFCNILTGVCPAYSPAEISGHILWNDQDISQYSISQKADIFSYLMQNPIKQTVFNDCLTQLTFTACQNQKSAVMIKTEMKFWLDWFGIHDFMSKKMKQLSWGQQKLMHLCTLLINDKPVVLLDEPMAGLSAEYCEKLIDCLIHLKKSGKIIFIVEHHTHLLPFIDRVLDFNHVGN